MSTARYPTPAWRVTLDGTDLTARIAPRLLSLELTECRGGEADQLSLALHDHDGRLALPRRGAVLRVALGWHGGGLVDKGAFRVDEVEHSGAPDSVTVRARSADLTAGMRTRRERSWHATTLGAVLRAMAGEHGLIPRIAPSLASTPLAHLDQQNESDVALLTRLGQRFDAVASVKAGALVFVPIGSGTTAGGNPLPGITLTRADGDRHRYSTADRDTYTGVRAYWNDRPGARRRSVLVGDDGNVRALRETYSSERVAREHADAEWKRLQRGTARFELQLALGRADLSPEQRVTVTGFKPEIDGTGWLVVRTSHTVTGDSGFTTRVEMERDAGDGSQAAT